MPPRGGRRLPPKQYHLTLSRFRDSVAAEKQSAGWDAVDFGVDPVVDAVVLILFALYAYHANSSLRFLRQIRHTQRIHHPLLQCKLSLAAAMGAAAEGRDQRRHIICDRGPQLGICNPCEVYPRSGELGSQELTLGSKYLGRVGGGRDNRFRLRVWRLQEI